MRSQISLQVGRAGKQFGDGGGGEVLQLARKLPAGLRAVAAGSKFAQAVLPSLGEPAFAQAMQLAPAGVSPATDRPRSACFSTVTICPTENRFVMANLHPVWGIRRKTTSEMDHFCRVTSQFSVVAVMAIQQREPAFLDRRRQVMLSVGRQRFKSYVFGSMCGVPASLELPSRLQEGS
jgi:hypothetical protein